MFPFHVNFSCCLEKLGNCNKQFPNFSYCFFILIFITFVAFRQNLMLFSRFLSLVTFIVTFYSYFSPKLVFFYIQFTHFFIVIFVVLLPVSLYPMFCFYDVFLDTFYCYCVYSFSWFLFITNCCFRLSASLTIYFYFYCYISSCILLFLVYFLFSFYIKILLVIVAFLVFLSLVSLSFANY